MNSADISSQPNIRRCQNCPEVNRALDCIKNSERMRDELFDDGFNPDLETNVANILPALSHSEIGPFIMGLIGATEYDTPETVAAKMRQSIAEVIESVDDHIVMHEEAIDDATEGCNGPFRMRAKNGDRIITVTLCNSPSTLDGGTTDEVVHIQRDR